MKVLDVPQPTLNAYKPVFIWQNTFSLLKHRMAWRLFPEQVTGTVYCLIWQVLIFAKLTSLLRFFKQEGSLLPDAVCLCTPILTLDPRRHAALRERLMGPFAAVFCINIFLFQSAGSLVDDFLFLYPRNTTKVPVAARKPIVLLAVAVRRSLISLYSDVLLWWKL